ncbi:MAG TPA: ABC transporter ATP-binding protein [Pirellulaceae bacterium]
MIRTIDLTKRYGDVYAIRSIELDLAQGDLFGFIGPNGAGKTTTMRILSTLLQPSWGEAYVGDYSIYTHAREIRRLVGFMPDFFGVYDDMTVLEYLEFFAAAYRIHGPQRRRVCNELLEVVDLDFKRDALANTLSRGQTQRLGLARVLLHDPQVLLLDEPLSGLDPRARIDMRNLLRRLGTLGKTMIVSSHILPELADICNKIGIIDRGVLSVSGSVRDVMRQVRQYTQLVIEVVGDVAAAAQILKQDPRVSHVESRDNELKVRLHPDVGDYSGLPKLLIDAGYGLKSFREDEMNLEAVFMALTKGLGKNAADGVPASNAKELP